MINITTRQCTHCHRVYLPTESIDCPNCAGKVPRKLRFQVEDPTPFSHLDYIIACARNPDVIGFRTGKSTACDRDRCRHNPQFLTVRSAIGLCRLPCRAPRDCYGFLEVVFRGELTDEQLAQIEPDL